VSGVQQIWLVAVRELRERSRSRAFQLSLLLMVLVVAGAIALPSLLETGGGTKDVGLTGSAPAALAGTIQAQGDAVGTKARIHRYEALAPAETAVREGHIDVLVVDGRQLEWRRRADEQLKAVVTGAIQLVAVQDRAAAAGISPAALAAVLAPVQVKNVELGQVAGRGPDDETAAMVMGLVLFYAIVTYGAMVMSGVVEEKASRVVEVLLARMPARNLLAGKIAGIGLLGLAQIGVTALAATVAIATVGSFDVPAVRGAVIGWAVVWFVLGYALYATTFGVLGSLASRTEDTQSVAGPVTAVLIGGYFVSFAAIGSPGTTWAKVASYFPATAPFAMPSRIAMGATSWWEPALAVGLTVAAVAGLVVLGGRVYTAAILHTGPTLKLREAWRGATTTALAPTEPANPSTRAGLRPPPAPAQPGAPTTNRTIALVQHGVLIGIAAALCGTVFVLAGDFIIGVAVAAAFYAVASRLMKAHQHAPH
jgi:ABC-2 type transport system permease protein